MQLDQAAIDSADIEAVVRATLERPLDRFPPLITHSCLAESSEAVARYAASRLVAGWSPAVEILTMPKRGLGPRPIVVLDPISQAGYQTLVNQMAPLLEPSSRGSKGSSWEAFQDFGLEGPHSHVALLDIASCYEYVEHEPLYQDLLARGVPSGLAQALCAGLGEVMHRQRGLPQMLNASDHLADAYLSSIERDLLRKGYGLSRYVDDFRVLADSWESANDIVEAAAEYARRLGLLLSSEKTYIRRRDTLFKQRAKEREEEEQYIRHIRQNVRIPVVFLAGPYGDNEVEGELPPEDEEARVLAAWRMLHDWYEASRMKPADAPPLDMIASRKMSSLIRLLSTHYVRIDDKVIEEIVFRHPQRVGQLCQYILQRDEPFLGVESSEDGWSSLSILTSQKRQSPWAKYWLLYTADKLREQDSPPEGSVRTWVRDQLQDSHEVVRAQAAWTAARFWELEPEATLERLYQNGSPLTAPALAAAAARQRVSQSLRRAIGHDGYLNRLATEWGSAARNVLPF